MPSRPRTAAAGALRSTALRPGAVRRIPVGIGRGLRLEVDPASTLHVALGTAEVEIARWIRRLARPGVASFDVGSNNAYYSLVLARLTGAPVAAIEFDPAGLARIRRNLERNPGPARHVRIVQAYAAAVVSEEHGATTLDRLATEVFQPGLLKIDVEGAEAEVLRGASGLLRARRPHVIIETHSLALERDCGELLAELGYRPVVVHQRRVLREGRAAAHNRWLVAPGLR